MNAQAKPRPEFWQNMTQRDMKNWARKAAFGQSESGSRFENPAYMAKLAPPPLPSERAKAKGKR